MVKNILLIRFDLEIRLLGRSWILLYLRESAKLKLKVQFEMSKRIWQIKYRSAMVRLKEDFIIKPMVKRQLTKEQVKTKSYFYTKITEFINKIIFVNWGFRLKRYEIVKLDP